MHSRIARLAAAAALVTAFAAPAMAVAADPSPTAPPASVVAWQVHRDHMRSMDGNLGTHLQACIDAHGSLAGQLGPNGSMVGMMGEGMMR